VTTHPGIALVDSVAALPGMIGCALVDIETGMAWSVSGNVEKVQYVCEAASDYWRLYMRLKGEYRGLLGELAAQVMVHSRGRITIVQRSGSMLLVCLSHEPSTVDWTGWKAMLADKAHPAA
jgi:hypothetical protein